MNLRSFLVSTPEGIGISMDDVCKYFEGRRVLSYIMDYLKSLKDREGSSLPSIINPNMKHYLYFSDICILCGSAYEDSGVNKDMVELFSVFMHSNLYVGDRAKYLWDYIFNNGLGVQFSELESFVGDDASFYRMMGVLGIDTDVLSEEDEVKICDYITSNVTDISYKSNKNLLFALEYISVFRNLREVVANRNVSGLSGALDTYYGLPEEFNDAIGLVHSCIYNKVKDLKDLRSSNLYKMNLLKLEGNHFVSEYELKTQLLLDCLDWYYKEYNVIGSEVSGSGISIEIPTTLPVQDIAFITMPLSELKSRFIGIDDSVNLAVPVEFLRDINELPKGVFVSCIVCDGGARGECTCGGASRVVPEVITSCLVCDNIGPGDCTCGRYLTGTPLGIIDLGIQYNIGDVSGYLGYGVFEFISLLEGAGVLVTFNDILITNKELLGLRDWMVSNKCDSLRVNMINTILSNAKIFRDYLIGIFNYRGYISGAMGLSKLDGNPISGGYLHE